MPDGRGELALSVATLAMQCAETWAQDARDDNRSIPGALLRHIDGHGKLRLPQLRAIETHLWVKFACHNKPLAEIVADGHLADSGLADMYRYQGRGDLSPVRKFFIAFAEANGLRELSRTARDEPRSDAEWLADLRALLNDYPYPNRIYSLPMGAGKTWLIAAFIYLDLHLSQLMPTSQRFAHNFIVLAPHAAKTAILPSLKTIREFDPIWVLPPAAAEHARREIHIEVLDSRKSASRSMRVENPNLDRVNRLSQTRERGLVFITNAEKVVLEQYHPDSMGLAPLDRRKKEEMMRHNALRDCMAEIPALAVFLDEAHHTYSATETQQKKLRTAVQVLGGKDNLCEVNGFSGTPFVPSSLDIAGHSVKVRQLQDVLYHYPLAMGISRFLKTPVVRYREDVREEQFIHDALDDFFAEYDCRYDDGTLSKIAFYCPTVKALNDEMRPAVLRWYAKHRQGRDAEVMAYYSADKTHPLPKSALADFHALDSPHSDKRVVLLVAVGKEGWDCRSLTAVALPRNTTTRNFVLQTSCRCLREVVDASDERALIYLGDGNYRLLREQLQKMHQMGIDDFQAHLRDSLPVLRRKPALGTLRYKQIDRRWTLDTGRSDHDPDAELGKFRIDRFMNDPQYIYNRLAGEGVINEAGRIMSTQRSIITICDEDAPLERYEDFLMALQQALWGLHTAAQLNRRHGTRLAHQYRQYERHRQWFADHPRGGGTVCRFWVQALAACFAAECSYASEELLSDVSIELLEWSGDAPTIAWKNGKFLPEVDRGRHLQMLRRNPNLIEDDLEHEALDAQDISFNYAPYRFDSDFEKKAILDMLQEQMLKDLELYYNGMSSPGLDNFVIKTPHGRYTPDFLLLQRRDGRGWQKGARRQSPIARVLIIETKGGIFYDEAFKARERFVKNSFVRHNPQFRYINFVDDVGDGNFGRHLAKMREAVKQWMEQTT